MLRLFTDVSSAEVFRNVGIYPIIVAFQKETSVYSNKVAVEKLKVLDKLGSNKGFVKQEYFLNQPNFVFVIEEADIEKLPHRIENNTQSLKKLCDLHSVTTGFEYKNWGISIKEEILKNLIVSEFCNFVIRGFYTDMLKEVRYQKRSLINPVIVYDDIITDVR